ncbi:hypothetical protein PoB_006785000 [Plakobranchus ocellatus]|uniref:Uncharacterized protein n=1 Tax=Plakobranchus ocellatus TaxID=259542 RepID=A0AAV4DBE2_9GAST|nr:hypothetical protein PoB_006785000 [Plakobranchus ocellatus]
MIKSSSNLPHPSRRESPRVGECALKSPSTRKGFGSCPKSSARESFETEVLGSRYREQMVRVFSKLIVAAAACWPVFLHNLLKNGFRIYWGGPTRPRGTHPGKKQGVTSGRQLPLSKPAFLRGHRSRLQSIQQ